MGGREGSAGIMTGDGPTSGVDPMGDNLASSIMWGGGVTSGAVTGTSSGCGPTSAQVS